MTAPEPAPAEPSPSPQAHAHAGPRPLAVGVILAAVGVVYGDIGTSPLYTMTECLSGPHGVHPAAENVYGVVSLIFWAITLVVTIKYLTFLTRADNHGEGGIMALLALVPTRLTSSTGARVGVVAGLVLVGAALLYGDGVITPAISVLSAVEGLQVATSKLQPVVVPLTVVILIGLFWVQRRGTAKLGSLFGPIMVVWFTSLSALGVAHIVRHPGILAALSPHYGLTFFIHNGWAGFRVLGGVVLAVTGGEALYADMGHFGRSPIRSAWLMLVYPALVLNYLGQGAIILHDTGVAGGAFYAMVPKSLIYPMVILAAAATVIASQALISGVFSLTHQAIRLGYLPRLTILHTSGEAEGQIYVPLVNWALALACIALVLAFRESAKMAAAYGLAVSGTMLITSLTYYTVVRHAWGWSVLKAGLILAFFLSFDIPFLAANALKFLDGGYIPFCIGALFVVVMVVWRMGRSLLGDYLASQSLPTDGFLAEVEAACLTRTPGTAVYLASQTSGVPPTLVRAMRRFRVLHERIVLLTVTTEHVPSVPEAQRIETSAVGAGISRVILRYGFMDDPHIPAALARPLADLGVGDPREVLYILGREKFMGTSKNRMKAVPEKIFDFLSRNARRPTDYFEIPPEQVMELGAHVDL